MTDNKSRDIFYAVVAVATLIVALIGATLAYFTMTSSSAEGAVNARAAIVSVDYEDGQKVIAQADNLIPVSFDIMKQLYERNLDEINEQAETEYVDGETARQNKCKDGHNPNYDVCSVYRFSVSNDIETNIKAVLRTELNEFQDLAYAVRVIKGDDVTPNSPIRTGNWLTLDYDDENQALGYAKLNTCDNATATACYTGTDTKVYDSNVAIKSIFGIESPSSSNPKTMTIAANKYTFDVVLFILENDNSQDYDQGKSFTGNISVETVSEEGTITGRLS